MAETWTNRTLLAWAQADFAKRGVDSPRLDAELLLAEVLGLSRVQLYLDLDRPLAGEELEGFREMVARRRRREPVAYILGRRGFYGRDFHVGPAVLVPRPDTEALIERALRLLDEQSEAQLLDLCTGSGALGVTLAAERPGCRVDVADLSAEALAMARLNAEALGVAARMRFFEGDLCAPLEGQGPYELVVVNPPYIPAEELGSLMPEVSEYEPRVALEAAEGGLAFYRRLALELPGFLSPGGHVLMEVGQGQAGWVMAHFESTLGFSELACHRDFGGVERVVEATYHPQG
ncbi:MAG: peptide chain release factor N(5)-glutamine methyltransferase [Deltaproteobacteria bacterium]|nr:peptide chain release factor N(5)-glutamine methyltransferase [Deltaproteobacteria bacterium]